MRPQELRGLRAVAIESTYLNLEREDLDVADVVALIADTGANCIRFGALSHNGRAYYPSQVMPHAPGLRKRDLVGEFAEECDKHGMALGVYSNSAFVEQRLATHPTWCARQFGEPFMVGERGRRFINQCHHSPYFERWLDATREIVARYRPAFYYIDCFGVARGCTCPFCRARFRRDCGFSVPRSASNPRVQAYFRWVERATAACAERAFDAVRQTHPETLVVWNRGSFWGQAGFFPEEVRRFSTTFGHGFHCESAVRYHGESFFHIDEQAFLADAVGTPAFTWVEYPRMPWSHLACPPAEIAIKAAKVFAGGARPMLWSLPAAPTADLRGLSGVKDVYKLAEKHAALFDDTSLVADTAVFFSTATSRWYWRPEKGQGVSPAVTPCPDYRNEFTGQLEALVRAHTPVRVVLEDDALSDAAVLFLPNTACLSRRQCARVRRFVRDGGGLVATYETSLYDENGQRRSDFGLADVFGASFAGQGEQVSFPNTRTHGGWPAVAGYARLLEKSALFDDLPAGFDFPVAGKTLHVRARKGADVPARLLRRTRYYCDFPGALTEWPGAVINRFGKGVCAYFPWQAGRASGDDHGLPDVETLIATVARFVRGRPPLVETDLPDTVTMTCRRTASGDVVIHLVNLCCDPQRMVRAVSSVGGCSITLRLPRLRRARALVANAPLKVKRVGNTFEIALPRIGRHEVIHVEADEID